MGSVRTGQAIGFGVVFCMAFVVMPLSGVAGAKAGKTSLDVCVALPGFDTDGTTFDIHAEGPAVKKAKFDDTAALRASSCSSYERVPKGTYTLTQSSTPAQWHLAAISCFAAGSSDESLATFDVASSSAKLKVKAPTVCLFSELPGLGGGESSGSSNAGTTTTTKPGTTTTTGGTTTGGSKGTVFCKNHPTNLGCRGRTSTTSTPAGGGTVTTLKETSPTRASP